ncbi:MAG: flagellar protein FliS [Agarilytica sp.]
MAIQPTSAAQTLESNQDGISSHQLISLLMAGGLERIGQARTSLAEGKDEDAEILVNKLIGIINGLRSSLNFEQGGEIALNLDNLYTYMLERIDESDNAEKIDAVSEVGELLTEVKVGWDDMDVKVPEVVEKAS